MQLISNLRRILYRAAALDYLGRTSEQFEKLYPRMAIFSFDAIGHHINLFGRYENPELQALAEIVKKNRLTGCALDVGANIGNHAIFFAELFDVVHAFEPNPSILPLLTYNLRNHSNVRIHPYGASLKSAVMSAVLPPANLGGGRIARNIEEGGSCVEFALRSLDEVDDLAGCKEVDLIKLDVEGHELEAITGAEELIKRHRPLIAIEQNADQIKGGSSPALDSLRSLGYMHFYEIRSADFRTPRWLPRLIGAPLRLIEGALFDPQGNAELRSVKTLESRSYPMLLVSWNPL
jgi:FkbM family methyltransferase